MKKALFVLLILCMSISLIACSNQTNQANQTNHPNQGDQSKQQGDSKAQTPEQTAKESKLVAMIIPTQKGDPFIKLSYQGIEKLAQEKNLEHKLIEALDKSEHSEQIRAMSEEGANPIYVMWDDLAQEVFNIAPEFPDIHYIIVDSYATSDLKNVKTITVEPQQASFIAGVVAANLSESKKVAFLGSMQMPVIDRFRAGFEAGVKYADTGAQCESLYIGGSDDPNKAAELTKQVIANGADVVMHAANKAGLGVIRAAEEMNVKAIGVDEWQGNVGATVVWSALKDISGAIYKAGLSSIEGNFVGGYEEYNIKTGISLYDDRDYSKLPQELKKKVDEVTKKLKSGEIEVPSEVSK